jgi:hypothetical protein
LDEQRRTDERPYILKETDTVYELTDIFDEMPIQDVPVERLNEEIKRIVAQIAEKISREVVPAVAERVIREEIEKLKKTSGSD